MRKLFKNTFNHLNLDNCTTKERKKLATCALVVVFVFTLKPSIVPLLIFFAIVSAGIKGFDIITGKEVLKHICKDIQSFEHELWLKILIILIILNIIVYTYKYREEIINKLETIWTIKNRFLKGLLSLLFSLLL